MPTIHTIGYYIDLILLINLFYWLVTTNSWTPGKKAVTVVVGCLTWNYLWACLNMTFLSQFSLDSWKAYGYQIPTLVGLLFVHYIMRKGNG